MCTEELVALTHILVPLSNPRINIYFCYRLNGLFILSLCRRGSILTFHRALPKPWQAAKSSESFSCARCVSFPRNWKTE